MYVVEIAPSAVEEVGKLRAFEGRKILDAIEGQLTQQPTVTTRHRKILPGLEPPFEAVPPLWELSLGEYRVFYDVNEDEKKVHVRAVRHKPPHKTSEEIL